MSMLHHATLHSILFFWFVAIFLFCSKCMSVLMVSPVASTWWRRCVSSSCTHPPRKKNMCKRLSQSFLFFCFVLFFIVEVHQIIFFFPGGEEIRMRVHRVFYVLCAMMCVSRKKRVLFYLWSVDGTLHSLRKKDAV